MSHDDPGGQVALEDVAERQDGVVSVATAKVSVAMRVSFGSARFQTKIAATRMAHDSTTRPSQTQRSMRRGSSMSCIAMWGTAGV